jgi:hypothetical protein
MFAALTAVLPRGLPAASITYHLRSMVSAFAIKVDIFEFLLLFVYGAFSPNPFFKALLL